MRCTLFISVFNSNHWYELVFLLLFILFAADGALHFKSEKEWGHHSIDLKSNPRKVHQKTQTTVKSEQKDDMDLLLAIKNKELHPNGTKHQTGIQVCCFYVFCMRKNW